MINDVLTIYKGKKSIYMIFICKGRAGDSVTSMLSNLISHRIPPTITIRFGVRIHWMPALIIRENFMFFGLLNQTVSPMRNPREYLDAGVLFVTLSFRSSWEFSLEIFLGGSDQKYKTQSFATCCLTGLFLRFPSSS